MKYASMALVAWLFVLPHSSAQTAGCLRGNCFNGIGTYVWETGDAYTGQWVNGVRTGLGTYDWAEGSFYIGYFKNGILEGKGMYLSADKTNDQFGYFQNGKKIQDFTFATSGCLLGNCDNGVGVYLWETNDIYLGEWVNGIRSGFGRYDWADGSWYIGYFNNNLLNGEGEYHPASGESMIGNFINNEFQGGSSGEPAAASAPPSGKVISLTESDFCSVIQTVIKSFAGNFEDVKGKGIERDEFSLSDSWQSNIRVTGTSEAKVIEGFLGAHNIWYNSLFSSSSWDDAHNVYESYAQRMKECPTGCCTMVQDESKYDKSDYRSHITSWLTFLVKDGWDDSYKELLVEIEIQSDLLDNGYEVVARVSRFDR